MPSHAKTTPLDAGDDVHVVWEAASGGKTQTLFKYGVQTRPPFFE